MINGFLIGYELLNDQTPLQKKEELINKLANIGDGYPPEATREDVIKQLRIKTNFLLAFNASEKDTPVIGYTAFNKYPGGSSSFKHPHWETLETFVKSNYKNLGKKSGRGIKTGGIATKLTLRLISMARHSKERVNYIFRPDLSGNMKRLHERLTQNPRYFYEKGRMGKIAERIDINPSRTRLSNPGGGETEALIKIIRRRRI